MENFSFLEYLIILLIGLLFFKEEIMPWIKKTLGITTTNISDTIKELRELVEQTKNNSIHLVENYNHNTTKDLQTIASNQKEMITGINKISSHQDLIRNDVAVIKSKQEEWEKYGIKTRK